MIVTLPRITEQISCRFAVRDNGADHERLTETWYRTHHDTYGIMCPNSILKHITYHGMYRVMYHRALNVSQNVSRKTERITEYITEHSIAQHCIMHQGARNVSQNVARNIDDIKEYIKEHGKYHRMCQKIPHTVSKRTREASRHISRDASRIISYDISQIVARSL